MSRLNVGASVRGAAIVLLLLRRSCRCLRDPSPRTRFSKGDPVANAVLPTAPRSVTLTFTEPLETSYSAPELFDETGSLVPGATSTIGSEPRSMTVQIPPGLGNGTYSLLWRTLSTVDGHTAQGTCPLPSAPKPMCASWPRQRLRLPRCAAGMGAVGRTLAGSAGDGGGGRCLASVALVVRPAISPLGNWDRN